MHLIYTLLITLSIAKLMVTVYLYYIRAYHRPYQTAWYGARRPLRPSGKTQFTMRTITIIITLTGLTVLSNTSTSIVYCLLLLYCKLTSYIVILIVSVRLYCVLVLVLYPYYVLYWLPGKKNKENNNNNNTIGTMLLVG